MTCAPADLHDHLMQPNTTTIPSVRLLACGLAIVAALSLAGCGSSGGSDAGAKATTTAASDAGGSSGGADGSDGSGDTATSAADGAMPDLDVCEELSKTDIEELLGGATLDGAKAQTTIPAPNCDYVRTISGGGVTMDSFVVRVVWNDPSYFDSQKELQTDEVPIDGIDAFATNDYGTILVKGESGAWEVTRGVELSDGGQAASQEQMTAIAQRVATL